MFLSLTFFQNVFSQISQAEAYSIVQTSVIGQESSNVEVYASKNIIEVNSRIPIIGCDTISVNSTSWFFFIDKKPYANWGHDCIYAFVDNVSRQIDTLHHFLPPVHLETLDVLHQITPTGNYSPNLLFKISKSPNKATLEHEYAIIISGGASVSNNHERYWNDCSAVYQTLVNIYHYDKNKIFVLMSDGTSPNADMRKRNGDYVSSPLDLDNDGYNDIQYAATKSNVSFVFNHLQSILTNNDNVFIFTTDHGGPGSTLNLWEETMTKEEFATEVNKLSVAQTINICMEQCYSGGYTTALAGNNRVIATACTGNEPSWAMDNLVYDEFCYYWTAAIAGYYPNGTIAYADYNNDGFVSMQEAFDYAKSHDSHYINYPSNHEQHETPQYSAPYIPNLGPYLTLSGVLEHDDDIMIRDSISDNGNVPSNVHYMWDSPDIWIEDMAGHPITNPHGNTECKVCVRVTNSENMPTFGGERLFLNWAKAGCDLQWDNNWSGNEFFSCGSENPRKGGVIGNPDGVVLPIIDAHSSKIIKVTWSVPMAESYQNCTQFDADLWHFCLVARVHDDGEIMGENLTHGGMGDFVTHNNNVAWKNISILNAQYNKAVVSFSNPFDHQQDFRLHFITRPNKTGDLILKHADVIIRLDDELVDIWKRGGSVCTGGKYLGKNQFLITEQDFTLDKIQMPIGQHYTIEAGVRFFTQTNPRCNEFEFDIIEEAEKEVVGGEHYLVIKDSSKKFKAIALEDKIALAGDSTSFTAQAIDEDAHYTWFSITGDTLAVGDLLHTSQNTTSRYVLEVVSDEDGYKDVDTVTVTVRRAAITSLTPNPANNQTVVGYRLAEDVTSATLVLANATGQTLFTTSLDVTQTTCTINLQSIPTGQYTVRIESQGTALDFKTLIIY